MAHFFKEQFLAKYEKISDLLQFFGTFYHLVLTIPSISNLKTSETILFYDI